MLQAAIIAKLLLIRILQAIEELEVNMKFNISLIWNALAFNEHMQFDILIQLRQYQFYSEQGLEGCLHLSLVP